MGYLRKGDTLYNILDSNTGEAVEYIKVQNPVGIVPDGVIYRQLDTAENGTEIFKRIYYDYADIKWWGAKCDGITDDTDAWQRALNSPAEKLIFDGTSIVSKTLYFTKSGITISGTSVHTSRLIKWGNEKHIGFGTISGINYDDIDAVLMSVDYIGDFTFTNMKFETRDNSDYVLFLAKTFRFLLEDLYLVGGQQGTGITEGLRTIQSWNCNIRKVRSRFCTYGFRIEGPNLEQNTSFNFDNCFAEYCDFGFKFVSLTYFAMNAVAADFITECAYWFNFSAGSINGCGQENSRAQFFRVWQSNIVVSGHLILNVRNYTGTPLLAQSKAKIEVWAGNRGSTGLTLVGSEIRGYPTAYRDGDADWIWVSDTANLFMENYRHIPMTSLNINNILNSGTLERKTAYGNNFNTSGSYVINDISQKPFEFSYNRTENIVNYEGVFAIRTQTTDTSVNSVEIPLDLIRTRFKNFYQSDSFLGGVYKITVKAQASAATNYFVINQVFSNSNVITIGSGVPVANISSISVVGANFVINFTNPLNRPIVEITRA